MKVAILHDSLMEFGGAERVLQVFIELFPQAHIYTAFADPSFRKTYLPDIPPEQFHTSFLQPLSLDTHTSMVQAISPLVWRSFNLDSYDLVISHSFHLMTSLVPIHRGVHITCLQALPKNIFGIDPPTPLQRLTHYDRYIKPMYIRALQHCRYVIVNSDFTKHSVFTHIGIPSTTIYPPVGIPPKPPKKPKGKFFICVSRMVPYKHLELPIIAANRMGVPLKIVGAAFDPSYGRWLRSIAGPTVEFLGFRPDYDKYFPQSIAFIFTSREEDFGIAPLEATANGVPVISYFGGGPKETIIEGTTGIFFRTFSVNALIQAMNRVQQMNFDPFILYRHAKKFGTDRFKEKFMDYVRRATRSTRVVRSGRSG